ncbi:MAG: rhodanese-like domain-containing protein [Candidatus Hodarchaeales archaeon]|jgi:hydroxyacylglutathione hydrolase
MGRWKRFKGKFKNTYKAYKFGLFNIRNIIRFMKIAPSEAETENVPHMTVYEVKEELDKGELFILDVRGQGDFRNAHLESSVQMSLFDVLDNLGELPRDKPIGVLCYGGGASMTVTQMLIDNGFDNAKNIKGGIIRYALDVDDELLGQL